MKPLHIVLVVLILLSGGLALSLIRLGSRNAQLQGELDTYRAAGPAAATKQLTPVRQQPPPPAINPKAKLSDDVAAAKIDALNAEIKALKIQLDSKSTAIERLQATIQNQSAAAPKPISSVDWMSRLKSENPDRYQRLITAQKRHTESVYSRVNEQGAFIANLDPALLPLDQQEKLIQLQEGLRHIDEIINPPADGPPTDPIATRRAYYSAVNQLRPLMASARQAALYDFAHQLGYSGSGATDFVDYLNKVYDITNSIGAPSSLKAPDK